MTFPDSEFVYPSILSPIGAIPAVGLEMCDVSSVDATPSQGAFRALYVGVTGNVAYVGLDGVNADIPNAAVGYHPVAGKKVLHTGTAASSIRFCY
jgi:hypothetical protein